MAYIDKIIKMRRFAVIRKEGGHILLSGVKVDDHFIFENSDRIAGGSGIGYIDKFCKEEDAELVYRDSADEDYWEPRSQRKGPLGDIKEDILSTLHSDSEYCCNYSHLNQTKEVAKPHIKWLRENGYIVHFTGLMTDDGEVAGSGWCRTPKGNEYVNEWSL